MNFGFGLILGLLIGVAFVGMGFLVPAQEHNTSDKWQKEITSKGYGEYILDPDTGKTTWQWKKEEVKQ